LSEYLKTVNPISAERDLGSGVRTDVVDKVESQLLGALELLQSYQAGEGKKIND
jgi:hypothetical protein